MNEQKIKRLVAVIAMVIAIHILYSFRLIVVNGHSMEDTIHNKQILIGYFCKSNLKIDRGDIVVFIKETKEHGSLLKRVIGIAGDKIELINNELYLNGNKIQEDYIKEDMNVNADGLIYEVPFNNVFVLGDNRNNSLDSRDTSVNYVNVNTEISGKVILDLEKFGVTYGLIQVCTIAAILIITFKIIGRLKKDEKN